MPNINAIRTVINNLSVNGTQEQLEAAWLSWFRAIAEGIEPNRLEAICQAERDNQHSISTRFVVYANSGLRSERYNKCTLIFE